MPDPPRFAAHLAALMVEKSISISELARRTQLERNAVQRWLSGKSLPLRGSVERIAEALGLPARALFTEDVLDRWKEQEAMLDRTEENP